MTQKAVNCVAEFVADSNIDTIASSTGETSYVGMKFSEKLEIWIGKRGLTQGSLAKQTGLSPSAISDMTAAKRRPYMDQALKLARALGLSLDYLADDELDHPPGTDDSLSDDERFLLQLIRDLGLGRAETVRRLATAAAEVSAGPGGRVQPVQEGKWLGTTQNLDELARREIRERKDEEKRKLGFKLDSDCQAGLGEHQAEPFPGRRK